MPIGWRSVVVAKITYIEFDGTERVLEVPAGLSLMKAAVDNSVQGIIGDCGGNCSCATCHVYIDPAWVDRINAKEEMEELLLEEVCDPLPNSRLACQVKVSDALEGLVVRVPARQF